MNLIKNYINKLTIDDLNNFSLKNEIKLSNSELEYLFNLIKNNYEDILVDETEYLKDLDNHINESSSAKIKKLVEYYKNRYKGYLF